MKRSTRWPRTSRVCAEPPTVSRVIALMRQVFAMHFRALVASAMVLVGPVACAQGFSEGVHYKALTPAQPTNVGPGKIEVVEVFWYACGHCFAIDPAFESWQQKSKPANVQVVLLPATWNDVLKLPARIFYTAELLGKLPQLHTEIFREINIRNNHLETPAKICLLYTSDAA